MKEINFFGVFLSPFLLWGVIAFFILSVLKRLIARLGGYHHIWHRALFDLSLYIIILTFLVFLIRSLHL